MTQLKYHTFRNHKIAYKFIKRTKKTIVFIHGLKSDMTGKKSLFLDEYCKNNDYSYLAFDCRGHGKSSGIFEELSIKDWFDDLKRIIKYLKIDKNIILIGSSMGGWLGCLYALYNPKKIEKLIGLAPAPDFTEKLIWKNLSIANKLKIKKNKLVKINVSKNFQYVYSKNLIYKSRGLLLNKIKKIYKKEVVFIHGSEDKSVPFTYNNNLLKTNQFRNLKIKIIKGEDHSLSTKNALNFLKDNI